MDITTARNLGQVPPRLLHLGERYKANVEQMVSKNGWEIRLYSVQYCTDSVKGSKGAEIRCNS